MIPFKNSVDCKYPAWYGTPVGRICLIGWIVPSKQPAVTTENIADRQHNRAKPYIRANIDECEPYVARMNKIDAWNQNAKGYSHATNYEIIYKIWE